MKIRAFSPGMAIAIVAATICTSLPAIAGSGKQDKGKKEPDALVAWLSSALRPKGVPAGQPVTICVTGQTLSWMDGKKSFTVAIPDARVSFKPWETVSQTWYGDGKWDTSVPSSQAAGKTFMSGSSLPLPAGLPRDVSKVWWRATFESDTAGISVRWSWSAAAYSHLGTDFNALGVAPISSHGIPAGTPLASRKYLVGGGNDDEDDDDDDDDGSGLIAKSETFQAAAPVTGTCGGAY